MVIRPGEPIYNSVSVFKWKFLQHSHIGSFRFLHSPFARIRWDHENPYILHASEWKRRIFTYPYALLMQMAPSFRIFDKYIGVHMWKLVITKRLGLTNPQTIGSFPGVHTNRCHRRYNQPLFRFFCVLFHSIQRFWFIKFGSCEYTQKKKDFSCPKQKRNSLAFTILTPNGFRVTH